MIEKSYRNFKPNQMSSFQTKSSPAVWTSENRRLSKFAQRLWLTLEPFALLQKSTARSDRQPVEARRSLRLHQYPNRGTRLDCLIQLVHLQYTGSMTHEWHPPHSIMCDIVTYPGFLSLSAWRWMLNAECWMLNFAFPCQPHCNYGAVLPESEFVILITRFKAETSSLASRFGNVQHRIANENMIPKQCSLPAELRGNELSERCMSGAWAVHKLCLSRAWAVFQGCISWAPQCMRICRSLWHFYLTDNVDYYPFESRSYGTCMKSLGRLFERNIRCLQTSSTARIFFSWGCANLLRRILNLSCLLCAFIHDSLRMQHWQFNKAIIFSCGWHWALDLVSKNHGWWERTRLMVVLIAYDWSTYCACSTNKVVLWLILR